MSDAAIQLRQTSFSNGEIDPKQYGNTAHPKFASSLRTCRNWIPSPQGALVKRPGTKFIANTKNDGNSASRFKEFVFSDTQSFLLEFSDLLVRFYQNGQYVGTGGLNSGAYRELATPFSVAMLPFLKFKQVGNTITITYGGQVPGVAAVAQQDLVHTAGAIWPWTIAATPLKIPITNVPNAPAVFISAWSNVSTYAVGDQVSFSHVLWTSLQDSNTGNSPPAPALNVAQTGLQGTIFWTPSVDQSHPAVTVGWVLTAVLQDPNGVTFETGPSAITSGTGPLSTDRKVPLTAGGLTSALPAGWTILFYKLYRSNGNASIFGFLQDVVTSGAALVYDQGASPDFTRQPPKGTDPFLINGADSYPAVIGYLDQRRLWAGSQKLPNVLQLSKAGDLYNYDNLNIPGADTDAFNVTLAADRLEDIRSFVPMRRGLIFTGQSEWAMAGLNGGSVTRSSNDPKRQSGWGSSWLDPIIIGNGVLFNTAKSNMVRDFYPLYGLYTDNWDGQDVSVMARHLLERGTIKAWSFQSVPYPVLWMVRNDGRLLSLTYQHAPPSFGQQLADGVVSWAWHDAGAGSDIVEDVCVVPEPPEDAVYLIVNRLVNGTRHRFIERMSNPITGSSPYNTLVPDVRYSRYTDAHLSYDGHNDQLGLNSAASMDSVLVPGSILAANYQAGAQILIRTTSGFVPADAQNPYGSAFVFDPENVLGLGPVLAHIVGYTSAGQVTAELDTACTQAQVNAFAASASGGYIAWAIAKGQITAAHLSGYTLDSGLPNGVRGVHALVDGDVQLPDSWAGGVASFKVPGVRISLGVAYNSDAALLDAFHPSAEIRNKFKNVFRVGFEVADTRDMWFGKDYDSLTQWLQRAVFAGYSVLGLDTGYFEDFVTGEENKTGAVVLRHFNPLPATITAVLREMRLDDT